MSPSRRSERRTASEEKEKASSKSVEILSSPVSKLYQFTTQNESFGSPQISKDVTKTKFVLSGFYIFVLLKDTFKGIIRTV